LRVLAEAFNVDVDASAPIMICGPYGRKHVLHHRTKILWTLEPWPYKPWEFDFTVSSSRVESRTHLRLPMFAESLLADRVEGRAWSRPDYATWKARPNFCNFIYSNPESLRRNDFFHRLSARRHVTAPGQVFTNADPIPVGGREERDWRAKKVVYQQSFRFTIAFENQQLDGYTSEKLADALAAGTIPIYWGNPSVAQDVRTQAFVAATAFESLDDLADYVVAVDDQEEMARPYLASAETCLVEPVESVASRMIAFVHRVLELQPRQSRRRQAQRAAVLTARDPLRRTRDRVRAMRRRMLAA
jgi:alpha(1,3/1,4) fucosyltransferase